MFIKPLPFWSQIVTMSATCTTPAIQIGQHHRRQWPNCSLRLSGSFQKPAVEPRHFRTSPLGRVQTVTDVSHRGFAQQRISQLAPQAELGQELSVRSTVVRRHSPSHCPMLSASSLSLVFPRRLISAITQLGYTEENSPEIKNRPND